MEGFNEKASHVDDEICMSHPELSFPDLRSLKMYRSIWNALFFFVLFFKPCLSTCFCLFKYSYCFYLILSHLTYKRKQMHMQTEIIISLMYSLISRETLLCWLWMPWLRHGALQTRHPKCASSLFLCVRVLVSVMDRKQNKNEGRKMRVFLKCRLISSIFLSLLSRCNW